MAECTKEEIRRWLVEGREQDATHTIVCCDTFSYDYYPVQVKRSEDVNQIVRAHQKEMNQVKEVYSLALDLDEQLAERRAFHTEYPPAPTPLELPEDRNRARLSDLAG
jgi:hypothetical protein